MKMKMRMKILLVLGFIGLVVVTLCVLIIPVSYQEEYQVQVSYQVEVPYNSTALMLTGKRLFYEQVIEAGHFYYFPLNVPKNGYIEVFVSTFSADVNLLEIYVFDDYGYHQFLTNSELALKYGLELIEGLWCDEMSLFENCISRLYNVTQDGKYFAVIFNPTFEDITVTSCGGVGFYEEILIEYKTETRYRTEVEYRTIRKTLTLWEYLMR